MSERKIRHVEDVFGEVNTVEPHHKPQNILDRKSSFNMFKNKQAPQPPTGNVPLPKIGNYQPKILLEKKPGEVEPPSVNHRPNHVHEHRGHSSDNVISNKAPLIIGDKDIPIRIENHIDDDQPVPAPRRKRRAPSVPEPEVNNSEPGSSNPIFGRSMSQRSDEEPLEMDIEEQGGDIDFGSGIDNPGFHSRERNVSGISRDRSESSSSWVEDQHKKIQEEHQNSKKGITYPYIPPPDYEDEEVTMDFEDDYEPIADYDKTTGYRHGANFKESAGHRDSSVYRELEGDDFGKYLQEEDYEFDAPKRPMRRPPPGGHFHQHRARPAPKSNKHIDKKVAKSKKKLAPEPNMKRNTIRDFTFSDSKIGWGDRTVKSTSAKGRYIKHNKERQRIDHQEMFNRQSGGSYEEFLRVKNGIPLESPNSSDSGVDTNEERNQRDTFYHSQPKHLKHGNYDQKPSMWQKLTWKFRKNPSAARTIQSERL